MPSQKTCFVICPIGTEGSSARKRSDKLFKYVIERVMLPKGYTVERADKVGEPGIITNQIVNRIVECDILIADLTDYNPNVFYELALRHGLKKPYVHMIDSNQKIPFDNAQVRAITLDLTDLDSVESACQQLNDQVASIENSTGFVESPISVAFDLDTLRTSGKPDEAILATVLEEISYLRRDVAQIRSRQSPPLRLLPVPKNKADIINILMRRGYPDLAEYISSNVDVDDISPGSLDISLSDSGEFKDIADELQVALRRATGRDWTISYLPF